ncbi:MAG: AAA family ATPase, partial [Paramuribaculum sp.]|nr:AAA family ATPase [Paramuribaculum sp.]
MALKIKSVWHCTECGADSPKWEGKCPSCGAWNTMVEERVTAAGSKSRNRNPGASSMRSRPVAVSRIESQEVERIILPSGELNRVLGGGLVPGSIVLVGGEPGIGKSTLVLQNVLSVRSRRVLYVSGEESATQIKMRADRIGRASDNVFIACETSLETIFNHISEVNPELLVIDSIQTIASDTLESTAGSVSQVRECAAQL